MILYMHKCGHAVTHECKQTPLHKRVTWMFFAAYNEEQKNECGQLQSRIHDLELEIKR